jgi:hypothetical protein
MGYPSSVLQRLLYNELDEISQPVTTEELEGRIDKLKELGARAVEFTGGKPMRHPKISELTRYAKSLVFTKVLPISSATGLDDLQISIAGVTPNAVTVKVLKPLRKKLEAVIRAAKFRVTLNAVVGSAASEEALEVVTCAQEHGFRPRVCFIHSGDGQLKLDPACGMPLGDYTGARAAPPLPHPQELRRPVHGWLRADLQRIRRMARAGAGARSGAGLTVGAPGATLGGPPRGPLGLTGA